MPLSFPALTYTGVTAWKGALDSDYDLVAYSRIPVMGTAKHADAKDFLGTAVVSNL